MLSSTYFLEGILSAINVVSLFVIVFFLEKNLRMNWILKDELNAFSVLLFISLGGLLLREILFLCTIIAGLYVGIMESSSLISDTTPWIVINLVFTVALFSTAIIILFKNTKIFIVNKGGKIWFKVKS